MKTLMMTLAATAALGLVLIAPANAQAGQMHVSISLGIPAVLYGPPVVYRPAVVYQPRVVYTPVRYVDYHHDYRHDRGRDFDHGRHYAPDYHHHGAASSHDIREIKINPRLQAR